jgi:chromosome segregation ATPase
MSESSQAEIALWQARCDDMSVAMEAIRQERNELRATVVELRAQLDRAKQMLADFQQALTHNTPY